MANTARGSDWARDVRQGMNAWKEDRGCWPEPKYYTPAQQGVHALLIMAVVCPLEWLFGGAR